MTRKRLTLIFIAILSIGFLLASISPADAGPPIRIMPLGDSITQGSSSGVVPDNSSFYISYRKALRDSLVSAGYETDYVGSLASGEAVFTDAQNEGHPCFEANQVAATFTAGCTTTRPTSSSCTSERTTSPPTPRIDTTVADVQDILDEIDRYEDNYGVAITVFLARIINTAAYDLPQRIAPRPPSTTMLRPWPSIGSTTRPIQPTPIKSSWSTWSAAPVSITVWIRTLHTLLTCMTICTRTRAATKRWPINGSARWRLIWVTAKQGSITIVKATQPSGGTGFVFAGDLGVFTLADGGSTTFSGLEARNYKITESLQLGWSLQSVSCSGGDFTLNSDGVTIHLDKAQNITCTFTNLQPAVSSLGNLFRRRFRRSSLLPFSTAAHSSVPNLTPRLMGWCSTTALQVSTLPGFSMPAVSSNGRASNG